MGQQPNELVLASTSPRRRALMGCLGVGFEVVSPNVSENMGLGEAPRTMVERLALNKAQSMVGSKLAGFVVGADTVVVLDGEVLGKPVHRSQAKKMLERLRARKHEVVTGVAVVDLLDGSAQTASQVSAVTMRSYSDDQVEAYVASGGPMDKAGAYGIQDRVFRPASVVEGCYTNIVGLPLCLTVDLLRGVGYQLVRPDIIEMPRECDVCPLKDMVKPVEEGRLS